MSSWNPNRKFSSSEARTIRVYQRHNQVSIDRMETHHIEELGSKLGWTGTIPELRALLGKERRAPVKKVGPEPYLNMNAKVRGRKKKTMAVSSGDSAPMLLFTEQSPGHRMYLGDKTPVEFRHVPVKELNVDEDYQRSLKAFALKYAKSYDYRAALCIHVSRRASDGKLWIVNGFQRYSAILAKGDSTILCGIVECTDRDDEASLFVKCNIDVTHLNQLDKFWAKHTAKMPIAIQVLDILSKHGFTVSGRSKAHTGTPIKCAGRLLTMANRSTRDLSSIMAVLRKAGGASVLTNTYILGGLDYIYSKHGDMICEDRLSHVLSDEKRVEMLLKDVKESAQKDTLGLGGGGSKYFAAAITKAYNKRFQGVHISVLKG